MDCYTELKKRHRNERDRWPQNLSLRVHRALSWLHRAEQCEDEDGRFIFLWIAFNAAYAQDLAELGHGREQEKSRAFIDKLIELDEEETLYNLLWEEFSASVRILLNNPYVFAPFWEYQQGNKTDEGWQNAFEMAKTSANHALGARDAGKVLGLVLSRLYTLRNQLVHGGATWGSDVNRDQLSDSTRFLGKLVPKIIELMMDNPNTLWGDPSFPVVTAL